MLPYRIEITEDNNGTFLITCPALPEVTTYSATRMDAYNHAKGAIEEALAARKANSEPIPESDTDV